MFKNETLLKIAEKHHKSVAQIILKWLNQRGIVCLSKSIHSERIKENFDIESFMLDDSDMEIIKTLDRQESSFFSHQDPNIIEWFAQLISERKNKD